MVGRGAHDAPTMDDPMTYGYQNVDLDEIYRNIYNMSYFAFQESALLGVGKWSIFEPKVYIMNKQVTILDHKILRILVPISLYFPYAVGAYWVVTKSDSKKICLKHGFFRQSIGF